VVRIVTAGLFECPCPQIGDVGTTSLPSVHDGGGGFSDDAPGLTSCRGAGGMVEVGSVVRIVTAGLFECPCLQIGDVGTTSLPSVHDGGGDLLPRSLPDPGLIYCAPVGGFGFGAGRPRPAWGVGMTPLQGYE
jgi:hypothetical protein